MGYEYLTKNGHNMFDMSSMLQKAIRRNDYTHAGYAANELYFSYPNYLWKRLIVISAEDCYGIMTKEILALKEADKLVNSAKKKNEPKDKIFISKAIILLCMALKNRDACYFACNYVRDNNDVDLDKYPNDDIGQCELENGMIPNYVYDVHTIIGKRKGLTHLDMIETENDALEPKQISLFDNGDWSQWAKHNIKTEKDIKHYKKFKSTRERIE